MMLGRSSWKAVVRANVQDDGTVIALGQNYWCPRMAKFAGWPVEVRVPEDDGHPAQVWSGHHHLASPEVVADAGFAYPEISAAAVAELSRRSDSARALVVRGQAALLIELLADPVEDAEFSSGRVRKALNGFVQLAVEFIPIVRDHAIKRDRRRDLERTKRREARLRLAQSIFDLPYTIHGRKPSCEIDVDRAEGKQTEGTGHRLSEVAK